LFARPPLSLSAGSELWNGRLIGGVLSPKGRDFNALEAGSPM
jgi:hypothetical protein